MSGPSGPRPPVRTAPAALRRDWVVALGPAVPVLILSLAAVTIPLAVAQQLGLSRTATISWVVALYGVPGALSLAIALLHRQPVLLTGNVMALVVMADLGTRFSYPEIVGATMAAGAVVALVGAVGLTGRLAAAVPPPVMYGVLAGGVLPFVVGVFTSSTEAPLLVGAVFVAYLVGQQLVGRRLPAVLPALAVGLAIAAATGQLGSAPDAVTLPIPTLTWPAISLPAIASVTPVLVVLITLQSNAPSLVYLRSQGYAPSERLLGVVSGAGTIAASLLGPTAVSLSLPATALVAGTAAGDRRTRHRAVYASGAVLVLIGVLAGFVAVVPDLIPIRLLLALAGLAVVGVLSESLQRMAQGPLLRSAIFAFAVALSEISVLGLGSFFWALVVGVLVARLDRSAKRPAPVRSPELTPGTMRPVRTVHRRNGR